MPHAPRGDVRVHGRVPLRPPDPDGLDPEGRGERRWAIRPGRALLYLLAALLVPLAVALGWRASFVDEPSGPPGVAPPPDGAAALPVRPDLAPFDAAIDALDLARVDELDRLVADADLPALVAALTGGRASARELVAFHIRRVRARDGALRSVVALNPDALAEADRLDAIAARGASAGPLHGVPVLVKDNVATRGLPTTVGAAALAGHVPDADAPVVARLRAAGAVILGKTNLSEWAFFMSGRAPSGHSAVGGQTMNPFGAGLEVLGSSSGSAVAAAARFAPATLGTETTGSIVAPAAANGVAGLRPSAGLVDGALIAPIAGALDGPGPIARRVADLAAILDAIAEDPPPGGFVGALDAVAADGLRLGVPVVPGFGPATVSGAPFDAAVAALKRAGATVVPVEVSADATRALVHGHRAVLAGRMAAEVDAWLAATGAPVASLADVVAGNAGAPAERAPYGQDLLELAVASTMTADEHAALVARYRATALDAIEALGAAHELDALLSTDNLFSLFYAAAGVAAATVPIGRDGDGQPHGATLVAVAPGQDARLLGIARAVERVAGVLEDPFGASGSRTAGGGAAEGR